MRLRLGVSPSLKSSFARRLGAERPVAQTKKRAPTSSGCSPARSRQRRAPFLESSSACSTSNAFRSGNDHSRPYHPSGWQKWRVSISPVSKIRGGRVPCRDISPERIRGKTFIFSSPPPGGGAGAAGAEEAGGPQQESLYLLSFCRG